MERAVRYHISSYGRAGFRNRAGVRGRYCAECLTENIFSQGDTWEELRQNVREAVAAFFFDAKVPITIRLHLVRDEV